jgi:putative ABC transport system permease protein
MLNDVRYAIRKLRQNPGFAFTAIVSIALASGANTAIFSVLNAVLLRPLPYANPHQLVIVWEKHPAVLFDRFPTSPADFEDWKAQAKSFERLSAFGFGGPAMTLTGAGDPESLSALKISTDAFDLVGVQPYLGRTFRPGDEQANEGSPAIISHSLWSRRFNSDAGVIGRSVTLDRKAYTIVGVMPRGFSFPPSLVFGGRDLMFETQVWIPLDIGALRSQRGGRSTLAIGRLRPNVSIAQAQAEMDTIAHRLEQQYPDTNEKIGVIVASLHDSVVRKARPALLVLMGGVGLVLIVACANVANLLLARSTTRSREMTIRTAIGASWSRLTRLVLTESILLSAAGTLLGLLLAQWILDIMVRLAAHQFPRMADVRMDGVVFGFTIAVAMLSGIVFGLAPSFQSRGIDLNGALKQSAGEPIKVTRRHVLRSALVVAEVALALVLLIGSGLLVRSLIKLRQTDLGFNPRDLITSHVVLPATEYSDTRRIQFYKNALDRIEAMGGAASAGLADVIPLGGTISAGNISIEGQPAPPASETVGVRKVKSSSAYFRTMGIPLLRGRSFSEQDRRESTRVVVINEALARTFWHEANPLGRRMKYGDLDDNTPWLTVIGVVGNVRGFTIEQAIEPEAYTPFTQDPPGEAYIVIRPTSVPQAVTGSLRTSIASIDPNLPVEVETMDSIVDSAVSSPRVRTILLASFAVLALILTAVGIYGVVSYFVGERTREIGIRMALGARKQEVLRLVLGKGLVLTAGGLIIGTIAAAVLMRVLSTLLFGVTATDPLTYATASVVLLLFGLGAILLPAWRATRVDPVHAIRHD